MYRGQTLLFIQNNSQLKNITKTCLRASIISSSSTVYVQVCPAPQIFSKQEMSPYESSCCFCHVFGYYFVQFQLQFLLLKRVKCPPFFFHNQNNSTSSPVFSLTLPQLVAGCIFGVISSLNTNFFQIWSSLIGYGELCVCFQPFRIGEIF